MKKKFIFILIMFFCLVAIVKAESRSWLKLDWTLEQGFSYYTAKSNSQTAKLSDGTYLSETLNASGLGVLRRISNDGKEIIWEVVNEYGYYYGLIYEKDGYIYTTYFDPYYGTYLIQYDLDGNYVDEVQLTDISDCEINYCDSNYPRVYDGEMYLKDNKLYIINFYDRRLDNWKLPGNLYPYYYHIVDISQNTLNVVSTTKLKESSKDEQNQIYSEINSVSSGHGTIITKEFGERNEELALDKMFVTQQFNSGEYTYFVGYEINENQTPLYGFIYKLDKNNNVVWIRKSPLGMLYYDATSLSSEYIAVTAYSFKEKNNMYDAYIYVYDKDGEIIETHNVNEELGTYSADIMSLQSFDNEIIAQVLTSDDAWNYSTYLIRYLPDFLVSTKVNGKGKVEVVDRTYSGQNVSYIVTPEQGFVIGLIKITDANGNVIETTDNTFIMPSSDVTIEVTFLPENPNTSATFVGVIILALLLSLMLFINNYNKLNFMKK